MNKPRSRSSQRRNPSQERSKATVEALLEATAQVLVEDGYARASTNRIAERAGVSVGSLYQYFPNKDALILELMEQMVERQFGLFTARLAAANAGSSREFVRETVKALIQAKQQETKLTRVLFEQIPRTGSFDLVELWIRRFVDLLHGALLQHAPQLRPTNLRLAAWLTVQAFHGIVHHAVIYNPEILQEEDFIDEVTILIAAYLQRPPHDEAPPDY